MWLVLGNLLSPEIVSIDEGLLALPVVFSTCIRGTFSFSLKWSWEIHIFLKCPVTFLNFLPLYINMHFFLPSLNLWCFASLEIRNHFAPWPWLSEDRFCSLKPLFGSFIFHFTLRGNSRKPILYLLWLGILNFSFKGPVAREKTVSTFGKEKGNLLEWWPTELSGLGKSDPQKG